MMSRRQSLLREAPVLIVSGLLFAGLAAIYWPALMPGAIDDLTSPATTVVPPPPATAPAASEPATAAPPGQRRLARTAGVPTQSEPQPVLGPGGAVGMTVPEELQTFMVTTRLPDGRIVMEHATDPQDARAKPRARSAKANRTARKEEPNDR